jgi:SAM-dependent methyltransferase
VFIPVGGWGIGTERPLSTDKYDAAAEGWSDRQYADAKAYLEHRAELVQSLGPALEPGDTVLDLACGDAGLADPLLHLGLGYIGVDLSRPMVEAARRRVGERARIYPGDLNDFRPREPVAATSCFRAIYYARDRRAFFRHAAAYTEKKLVFDLNPRQFALAEVRADLEATGFDRLELRPFFSPQRVDLAWPLASLLRAAERSGPVARLALRFRFTYMCSAARARA